MLENALFGIDWLVDGGSRTHRRNRAAARLHRH
jgi:hypothetical protein